MFILSAKSVQKSSFDQFNPSSLQADSCLNLRWNIHYFHWLSLRKLYSALHNHETSNFFGGWGGGFSTNFSKKPNTYEDSYHLFAFCATAFSFVIAFYVILPSRCPRTMGVGLAWSPWHGIKLAYIIKKDLNGKGIDALIMQY